MTTSGYRNRNARHQAAWRLRYPEKARCHNAVVCAVSRGQLTRLPCCVCGAFGEAHHPDHSDPMTIIWLCKRHHEQIEAGTLDSGLSLTVCQYVKDRSSGRLVWRLNGHNAAHGKRTYQETTQ